jgi:hypothetical protein
MRQVLKYQIPQVCGVTTVKMPSGSKVISAINQFGVTTVYAIVPSPSKVVERVFTTVMTGEDLPDDIGDFIGTVEFSGGSFILHVFCKPE